MNKAEKFLDNHYNSTTDNNGERFYYKSDVEDAMKAYKNDCINSISDEMLIGTYKMVCKAQGINPNEDYIMGLKIGVEYSKKKI